MLSFNIGDLALLGNNVTDYILQTPIEGFDAPDYRQTDYQNPGEDGGAVPSALYGGRPIRLQGIIKSESLQGYEDARKNLAKACRINRDSTGYPKLTRISFTTLAGNSYFVDASFRKPIFDFDQPRHTKFFLTALAPQPELYSSTRKSSGIIHRQSGSGFVWPFTWPFTWGTSTGGNATLVNAGDMASYPILTLTGSATNPSITNTLLGRTIQLNYTMVGSDVLVIDMKQRTIMLNGTQDMSIYLVRPYGFWWLEPNDDDVSGNPITFNTGSSSDTGTLEVGWYDANLGA